MTALSHIRGIARGKGALVRAPLTGRRCVEYRVVVTWATHGASSHGLAPEVVYEDGGFVPWTLEEVRCASGFFDPLVQERLTQHGNGRGGFEVLAALGAHAISPATLHWRLASNEPRRHRILRAAAGLGFVIPFCLPVVLVDMVGSQKSGIADELRELSRELVDQVRRTDARLLHQLGLGAELERAWRANRAEGVSFTYSISELVIRPGDAVEVLGANTESLPLGSDGYRGASAVRRGLVPPRGAGGGPSARP